MILRGLLVEGAPFFAVPLRAPAFGGLVWFLADTGASRTTILDGDLAVLNIPPDNLSPVSVPILGIGGPARSFVARDVEFTINAKDGQWRIRHDLCVAQHPLRHVSTSQMRRLKQLPSVLGRDLLGRFGFWYDVSSGVVELRLR